MIRSTNRDNAQCLANITAWLDWHRLPALTPVTVQRDRVVYEPCQEFLDQIQYQAGEGGFARWDMGMKEHGLTALYSLRECVARCSAQVVVHRAAIEIDFDLFNPDFGVAPAIGHAIECLWPGKTDPRRVRRGLIARGLTVPLIGTAEKTS